MNIYRNPSEVMRKLHTICNFKSSNYSPVYHNACFEAFSRHDEYTREQFERDVNFILACMQFPWDKHLLGEHRNLYPFGPSSEEWTKLVKIMHSCLTSLHAENHTRLFLVLQLLHQISVHPLCITSQNLPSCSPLKPTLTSKPQVFHRVLMEYLFLVVFMHFFIEHVRIAPLLLLAYLFFM